MSRPQVKRGPYPDKPPEWFIFICGMVGMLFVMAIVKAFIYVMVQ
jgi:hypothetical protein